MINYVNMTNFRGLSTRLDFFGPSGGPTSETAPRVELRGQNGSRKTTVREAIAFVFTGKDSLGTPKPLHLISMGEESCEVEVMTRKGAVIRRSLTRKGGGSLRMLLPGREQMTLTQSDFEGMLCPSDVFLSVLVPGFLLGHLPKNRQSAVLSYILPPVDRKAYMQSAVGGSVMDLDYSKRPDILQKQLADQRNEISHKISRMQGELSSLKSRVAQRPPKPVEPLENAQFDLLDDLKRQWDEYEVAAKRYADAMFDREAKKAENEKIAMARQIAERTLSELKEFPYPEPPPPFAVQRPLAPMAPPLQNEESRDLCPSCGQAVGLKHRELVRAQNQRLQAEYERLYALWEEALRGWQAEHDEAARHRKAFEEKVSEIRKVNDRTRSRIFELENDLRSNKLQLHVLSERVPELPKKPAEAFSQARYDELKTIVRNYYKTLGAYDSWAAVASDAEKKIEELERGIAVGEQAVELYREHEEALRLLPGYELTEQKVHLKMSAGYEIRVDDGIELFDATGCPYDLLSRGQKMHADFEICLKVNSLLQRKVGMVFLDDFDLADWGDLLREAPRTIQIFIAHVEAGKGLEVRLCNPV